MTIEAELMGSAAVLMVKDGVTVPTCSGEPLSTPLVVTTAVRLPAVGAVLKVTVSAVAVAEVTMPEAPPLNETDSWATVVSKPDPLMVIVAVLAARLAALVVTTGATAATWTGVPLPWPLEVTTAVRLPAVGFVEKLTVSEVALDPVTVPTAPLLKTTVLLPGVALKPEPLMVIVAALAARAAVLAVTAGPTVATRTA